MSRWLKQVRRGGTCAACAFCFSLGSAASGLAGSSVFSVSAAAGGRPPVAAGAPTLGGAVVDGSVLRASSGLWTTVQSYRLVFQWQRCRADGSSCADVPGANSAGYALTGGDVGLRLRVVVSAAAAGGSVSQSALSDVVRAAAPSVLAVPRVGSPSGLAGVVLAASGGGWAGTGRSR